MRIASTIAALLIAGCGDEPPPPIPMLDGGWRDAGRVDARVIRRDAGPPGPVVDGTIGASEWVDAMSAEASVDTDRPGSTLTALRALIEDERLFVAVEGTVADGDSIVVYVDRDGGAEGVTPSELADADGALDTALTQPSLDVASFAIDLAWGTTAMPHEAVGLDDQAGWRDVANDPDAFGFVAAEDAPTVCSTSACETSIALERLGGTAPRTIALFARIVRGDGGFANQTLPEDDAAQPEVVRALLTIEQAPSVPDAGVPDAGPPDAGGGVVIDGRIVEPEWAVAGAFENDVPPAGSFGGNTLTTLRALRDATTLYVAIEGTLTSGNAILMYVDRDLGGDEGLVLGTMGLTDGSGALDRALTKDLFSAELRIDAAWGTTRMSGAASSDQRGWRDLATNPANYRTLTGMSACTASACETSIALSALGVLSTDTIAIVVRLGSAATLTLSNQTLPLDDPASPETVLVYAQLPP